ncbi:MAG TPA: TolC family protein [Chroococcales cyanobacterium]|jgi:outer membrane protein TolC
MKTKKTKKLKKLFLLLCILLFPSEALCAPLTLRDAVRTALVENPEVAAAEQDAAVLGARVAQARSHHWPSVALDAGFVHLSEEPVLKIPPININLPADIPLTLAPGKTVAVPLPQLPPVRLPNIPLARQNLTEVALSVQLPLYTGGRVEYGVEQLNQGVIALRAKADSKRDEIAYSVVKAYLGAVLAQRSAEVAENAYSTVEQHQKQAAKAVEAGMVPRYEEIRARAELANQDRRRLDAHNQADLAMALLMDTLGTPEGEPPTLTTPLKFGKDVKNIASQWEPSIQEALDASHDLKALAARDRAYQAAEKGAAAELLPTVALQGSQEIYNKGLFDKDLPMTSPGGFIGLVAHLPLFDGGNARAKKAEQSLLRQRNQSDERRLRNGIRLEVRKYNLDQRTAQKALQATDQAIALASENLRLATRRFAVGEGTGLEKMDAILTLSIAETNQEQARYQYDLAYYGLKKAMGAIREEF